MLPESKVHFHCASLGKCRGLDQCFAVSSLHHCSPGPWTLMHLQIFFFLLNTRKAGPYHHFIPLPMEVGGSFSDKWLIFLSLSMAGGLELNDFWSPLQTILWFWDFQMVLANPRFCRLSTKYYIDGGLQTAKIIIRKDLWAHIVGLNPKGLPN